MTPATRLRDRLLVIRADAWGDEHWHVEVTEHRIASPWWTVASFLVGRRVPAQWVETEGEWTLRPSFFERLDGGEPFLPAPLHRSLHAARLEAVSAVRAIHRGLEPSALLLYGDGAIQATAAGRGVAVVRSAGADRLEKVFDVMEL